jgi:CDP-2,3-bis-(O-geranylgeranyl)-sn-glycerol synthase
MEGIWSVVSALLLLLLANGAPILAQFILGDRYSAPLDFGLRFSNGRSILGPTKTWRGIVSSLIFTTLGALALGVTWWLGLLFALFAMLGDVSASFIKRLLGIKPQGQALGLDQIPEALLPLWLTKDFLGLDWLMVLVTAVLFMLLELLLSPLLYRWHIRLRPY